MPFLKSTASSEKEANTFIRKSLFVGTADEFLRLTNNDEHFVFEVARLLGRDPPRPGAPD